MWREKNNNKLFSDNEVYNWLAVATKMFLEGKNVDKQFNRKGTLHVSKD